MSIPAPVWLRRARPLLGTLVEVGVSGNGIAKQVAVEAAFEAVQRVQACMSRFKPASDVSRFAGLEVGQGMEIAPETAEVLHAAHELYVASQGLFDITQGHAPEGWYCDGLHLSKQAAAAVLDLGGIAKGYAVDCAIRTLQQADCHAGWVNAGGDLRVFGEIQLPVMLRDETSGGVRPFMELGDGAVATSYLGPQQLSRIWTKGGMGSRSHVSVAAPICLWADALTKVVAASGDEHHPLLARYDAKAWIHREA